MDVHQSTSRRRFEATRQILADQSHDQHHGGSHGHGPASGERKQRRDRSAFRLVGEFLKLLGAHRLIMGLALGTLTLATLLALIPPAATKFVIDNVLSGRPLPASVPAWIPRDPWQLLLTITAAVLLVSVAKMVLQVWGRWQATRITKLLQMSVRRRVFSHVMQLPLHRIHEMKSGGAASILRQDAGAVGELVFGMLYNPWRAVVQLTGSLMILAWVDWRLLLGAVVLVPMVYLTHRTWIGRIRPLHRKVRRQREEVDAQTTESFGGMRIVRAFGQQRAETNRIMRGNHLLGRHELLAWWWTRIVEIVWETLIPLATAALFVYGGWRVLQDRLTLGDLMMFLVYLLMLLGPLAILAQSAAQFQNSLSGLDRVLDLLDEPRELASDLSPRRLDPDAYRGRLTFEDVSFRYPKSETDALVDFDLDVHPGETIALVGPSGSGKTTLCNLVARFYDPTQGRILLDGSDLRQLRLEDYRGLIGIVEQDVFLFDGTVAANIGYGSRTADEDQVIRAATLANAHEFICQLPNGYNTVIGERGVRLSGGQRQRIAIARAVLADPQILILDEATSNLDTESERLIQTSLMDLMRDRTSFVIAHRLSTIVHADRIVVLRDGQIEEVGTHAQLMERAGSYHEMVLMQTAPAEQRQ